ncbi:PPOX class F420-dependent oxidoreductase [Streptomyces violascens]|uniref:Pyridoxamine 5'-phosphate oxidase N-terminal domain-containing protein n=1 Tax=Streptomyces violascens TaxID=67381 RepID=A0ABQ3QS96_9ACTN|nr:PPOX class F420-dependent oxidoreductase [Streptomyces violascens]GHI40114.1 hypothetical protein Sviol_45220 [Streptomyces violascens]
MGVELPKKLKEHIDSQAFATLATIQPDGTPQTSVEWITRDGDDLLISTVQGRRKHLNMVREPNVSLLLSWPDNPYTYAEARGEVTMTTQGGRELIDQLSHKYKGEDYSADGPDDVRVVVRLSPRKIVGHNF